jgi:hypothetical protein
MGIHDCVQLEESQRVIEELKRENQTLRDNYRSVYENSQQQVKDHEEIIENLRHQLDSLQILLREKDELLLLREKS